MKNCPCRSGKIFQECCEPYIKGTQIAPTPDAVMRSRYTAYTIGDMGYIEQTMKGPAAENFDRVSTLQFATESEWQGLDIIRSYQPFPTTAYVEFVAHYNDSKGRHQHMNELSEFQLQDGQWYYVDGKQEVHHHNHHNDTPTPVRHSGEKLGRNDPCHCKSGKKYKKCCGA